MPASGPPAPITSPLPEGAADAGGSVLGAVDGARSGAAGRADRGRPSPPLRPAFVSAARVGVATKVTRSVGGSRLSRITTSPTGTTYVTARTITAPKTR